MLAELFRWWLRQMADLLPSRWFAGPRFADAIVLRPGASGLSAALRRRGSETPLGLAEPGGVVLARLRARRAGPVLLALPPSALLEQQTSLPLAAERELGAVLGHEIDRLTPFALEDLYWTWRVQGRDRTAGRLLVRLLLVPKAAAAAALAAITAAGLRPAAIEIASPGGVEHLPLTPPGAARRGLGTRFPAALCAALGVAMVALPILRQERAIALAQDSVAALRPRVSAVSALRRRIESSGSGAALFAAEHGRAGNALHALAAVTAALPDDTYLTALAIRQRVISLSGRSASAVRLIGLLAADHDLRDPAFDAPVLRTTQGGIASDQFSIRVSLAP